MHEHDHKGGGFFNGFIVGLLIGGGLVFLFGTSKGKKVLQMLLDQVEENTQLSELLEMPDDEDEEMMGLEEEEPEYEEDPKADVKVHDGSANLVPSREKSQRPVAKVKRFFKGAPKKLVS